jgi:GNAT superfamily N-acetyltransferase
VVDDAKEASRMHAETWRTSYRGLVPDALLDGLTDDRWETGWRRGFESMDPTRVVHVAEIEGRIAGFAGGGRARPGAPAGYIGEVYALYVRPAHQRRGIGRILLKAAASGLVERGLVPIVIWTLFDNPLSRGFYESLGGTVIGEKREPFDGYELHEVAYGWRDPAPLL